MRANPRCRSAVVFAGFLWAATLVCADPAQAQTPTKPDAATSPRTEVQATQKTPKNTPAKMGVWHHFGESVNPPRAGQSQPGVGHTFGSTHGAPRVAPDEMAPRQDFGADRRGDLERQMWALVNHARLDPENAAETGGRAQPLRWNEGLASVARAHSRDMLEQGYFNHVDRAGKTPSTRINQAGIGWRAYGENIAIYPSVLGAEAAFMNEPRFQHNHRYNILNANYTDVGIGIVQGANGSLFITQDFIAIPANGEGAVSAPRPTYKPAPGYTLAARKAKIEGEVALAIVVDSRGNVIEVKQTSHPLGEGLDESAVAALHTWKFDPARRDGVPVAMKTVVKVTFKLLG